MQYTRYGLSSAEERGIITSLNVLAILPPIQLNIPLAFLATLLTESL